jgi:hypothetical protein
VRSEIFRVVEATSVDAALPCEETIFATLARASRTPIIEPMYGTAAVTEQSDCHAGVANS